MKRMTVGLAGLMAAMPVFALMEPASVSENLAQLRVRDLLTMNAGKRDHLLRDGGNWAREFLSLDFTRRPGTSFKYDSDATYMLATTRQSWSGWQNVGVKALGGCALESK